MPVCLGAAKLVAEGVLPAGRQAPRTSEECPGWTLEERTRCALRYTNNEIVTLMFLKNYDSGLV